MPFRGEIVGIDALAQTLFGKHAERPRRAGGGDRRGAGARPERARRRRSRSAPAACCKLQRLDCAGVVGADRDGAGAARRHAARRAARAALRAPASSTPAGAPVQREHARRAACSASRSRTLRRQLAELAGRNVEDGAVVVLDNASGDVLAWVGSSGELSGAAAGRRRAGAAPARLDAEALRLRARVRAAPDHAGDAARRFAGADRDRAAASTCRRTTTTTSRAGSARAPRSARA